MKPEETFNCYSHFLGAVLAVSGLCFLFKVASFSMSATITALVYGLSIVFLFTASTLYHAFKKEENEISFWRKLDKIAIFFMIAGSYTPVSYFCLEGAWRWSMIGLQWGLVLSGIFLQLIFPKVPRALTAAIYLAMGWLAIFPIRQILSNMTLDQKILLFSEIGRASCRERVS
jgi:hemolysin III